MVGGFLLRICQGYSVILGVSSYFRVSKNYRETWLTRGYVLVVNVLTLSLLPFVFWMSAQYVRIASWFPNLLTYTTYILYTVSYATIAYTLISRSCRDKALLEADRTVQRLNRGFAQDIRNGRSVDSTLRHLHNLKLGSVLFVSLASFLACLAVPNEPKLSIVLCVFLYSNAKNIPLLAVHRYYLALWDIAYCYQNLNKQLGQLLHLGRGTQGSPSRRQLEHLQHLWMLHSLLTRCTQRLNKIYDLLMLAARFDNLAFFAINTYWGIVFSFSVDAPIYLTLFGAANYYVHLLDFYLLNFMCDQTMWYQSPIQHNLSEGHWSRELNAFVLYACTSKLDFWVCGLYKVNRRSWFQMQISIITFFILLLQFHLLHNKKYTS
ncbi:putative gustatory receptor 59b [Drosophila navojoa]|uniref:putative gustatory receptor 59b n=1 Tax=Drosophila navojoa TaxID=7232 RepID=UPI0011BD9F7B|nr:putative gustatory receptor 59b [Drosophila navojoa]